MPTRTNPPQTKTAHGHTKRPVAPDDGDSRSGPARPKNQRRIVLQLMPLGAGRPCERPNALQI